MDITLSDSEQQVRDGVRQLLSGEVTTDFVQSVEDSGQFPRGAVEAARERRLARRRGQRR